MLYWSTRSLLQVGVPSHDTQSDQTYIRKSAGEERMQHISIFEEEPRRRTKNTSQHGQSSALSFAASLLSVAFLLSSYHNHCIATSNQLFHTCLKNKSWSVFSFVCRMAPSSQLIWWILRCRRRPSCKLRQCYRTITIMVRPRYND